MRARQDQRARARTCSAESGRKAAASTLESTATEPSCAGRRTAVRSRSAAGAAEGRPMRLRRRRGGPRAPPPTRTSAMRTCERGISSVAAGGGLSHAPRPRPPPPHQLLRRGALQHAEVARAVASDEAEQLLVDLWRGRSSEATRTLALLRPPSTLPRTTMSSAPAAMAQPAKRSESAPRGSSEWSSSRHCQWTMGGMDEG